jgi:hypothetical protein
MNIGFHVLGAKTPARVQALAARNLQLLQAIESTLSQLGSDVRIIYAIAEAFEEIRRVLSEGANGTVIDPEGVACSALVKAADACLRIHSAAKSAHGAACSDRRLRSEDGVADAYAEYLAAVEAVHDSIESLRDWIATHEALLDPDIPGSFSSVDDLFGAMGIKLA